jgi:hypothetical protein
MRRPVASVLALVLALVLCQSGVTLIGSPRDASTPDSSFSIACPSIGPNPTIIRAKVDKTSSTYLEVPESGSLHLPTHISERAATRASSRPGLVFVCSPLASRPPPLT